MIKTFTGDKPQTEEDEKDENKAEEGQVVEMAS